MKPQFVTTGMCNMGIGGRLHGYTWTNKMQWTLGEGILQLVPREGPTLRVMTDSVKEVTCDREMRSVKFRTTTGVKMKLVFQFDVDFDSVRHTL